MPRGPHQYKKSDVVKMQTYYAIKEDLESEQAALLRERENLNTYGYAGQQEKYQRRNSYDNVQNDSPNPHFSSSNTQAQRSVVDTLKNKIEEVIDLCYAEENTQDYQQLLEVVEAEKEVLNFLNKLQTPVDIHTQSKKGSAQKKKHSGKKSKVSKTYNQNASTDNLKKLNLSDDALELIEEIERKALFEIESLRRDKINLLKKLNEQMREVNEERKSRYFQQQNNSQYNDYNVRRTRPVKHEMQIVDEEQNSQNYDYDGQSPLRPKSQSLHDPSLQSRNQGRRLKTHNGAQQGIQNPEGGRGASASSDEDIAFEVQRLRQENERIKRSITQIPNDNRQLKDHLRAQVAQLNSKIAHYQGLIRNSRRQPNTANDREYQQLLQQANSLTEQGTRLLTRPTNSIPLNTYNDQIQRMRQDSRPFAQTFSPMDRSFHSQAYKKGNSPTQYEIMIQEMRRATRE